MPEISRFFGITIYMYYDEHNPPHFHAEYENREILVYLNDLQIEDKNGFHKRAKALVLEWAQEHRAELMDNWHIAQNHGELHKIEGL